MEVIIPQLLAKLKLFAIFDRTPFQQKNKDSQSAVRVHLLQIEHTVWLHILDWESTWSCWKIEWGYNCM